MEKKCETCNEFKPDIEFFAGKNKPKKRIHCRECCNKKSAEFKRIKRAKKLQEKINQGIIKVPNDPENNFVCRGPCGLEKSKDQFRHNRKKCKDCEKKFGREYRQGDIGKEKSKKWTEENREKLHDYFKNKLINDPKYRFIKNKRLQINTKFKSGDETSEIEYLNCNVKHMRKWVKLNHDEKMNNENHGSYWHLEHVIPLNTFDFSDEQNKHLAFGWYNMSALEVKKNMNKKDKIDIQQLINHVAKLLDYIEKEENAIYETKNFIEYMRLCAKHLIKSGNPLEL